MPIKVLAVYFQIVKNAAVNVLHLFYSKNVPIFLEVHKGSDFLVVISNFIN